MEKKTPPSADAPIKLQEAYDGIGMEIRKTKKKISEIMMNPGSMSSNAMTLAQAAKDEVTSLETQQYKQVEDMMFGDIRTLSDEDIKGALFKAAQAVEKLMKTQKELRGVNH